MNDLAVNGASSHALLILGPARLIEGHCECRIKGASQRVATAEDRCLAVGADHAALWTRRRSTASVAALAALLVRTEGGSAALQEGVRQIVTALTMPCYHMTEAMRLMARLQPPPSPSNRRHPGSE